MKAQYGISAGIGQPLQWVSAGTAPWNALTSALAAEIKAIHVGIVARNPQFIQPATHGGSCDATVNTGAGSAGKPYLWPGGPAVDLGAALATDNPNWGCYKYRTFDLVMPLKNALFQ
jgi:type IV pilus assembly protein PilW